MRISYTLWWDELCVFTVLYWKTINKQLWSLTQILSKVYIILKIRLGKRLSLFAGKVVKYNKKKNLNCKEFSRLCKKINNPFGIYKPTAVHIREEIGKCLTSVCGCIPDAQSRHFKSTQKQVNKHKMVFYPTQNMLQQI